MNRYGSMKSNNVRHLLSKVLKRELCSQEFSTTRNGNNCMCKHKKLHLKEFSRNKNLMSELTRLHGYQSPVMAYCTVKNGTTDKDIEAWEALVNYEGLSPLEQRVHDRHRNAVKQGKLMYADPQTGYQVMTRVAHLKRGDCCGNACRHCPFGQANVTDTRKRKKFNTAFYV
ncbi:uncharacterized protein LOC128223106 [Mya arenaria]|uniref:uncharacterized protein LOC128223106 n=1 Tax=Mya arenaria TaxID=6604 RepID=UPI0022DED92E|nr:uncharacterized protein LOC128223106 [Mya arenaria]